MLKFTMEENNTRFLSPDCRRIIAEPVPKAISGATVSGGLRVIETFIITFVGIISYNSVMTPLLLVFIIAVALLATQAILNANLYASLMIRSYLSRPIQVLIAISGVFAIAVAITSLFGLLSYDKQYFFRSWFIVTLVLIFLTRQIASILVRYWLKTGKLLKRTVIVGGGENAEALLKTLESQPLQELQILGIFDDRIDARSPDTVWGIKKLGNIDDLIDFARHTRVDLAICTIPMTAETRVLKMMRKLWVLPIDIRLSAHTSKLKFASRSYSYIGEAAVLDVFDKPMKDSDLLIKSLFDKVIGVVALILLSPLMLITAIAIKIDTKGPVFFKQKRHGFNNQAIDVWKFRSMRTEMTDQGGLKQVGKGDPRVTRVGAFIRKTSIDELPQLFNVVFYGNLSLVGPRPHSVAQKFFQEVVDGYFARHKVKPGITGWAQINGWRGETDTDEKMQKRVEFDLHYTENWSLLFDLWILVKTPYSLFTQTDNAY
jgi:Undecaprenyl-phosphate glucose phosphotransferase